MDIVYLGLIDKFDDARVRGLDLKFAYFDGCNFYERPNGLFAQLGINNLETHMYLDGRNIDVARGGPKTEEGIKSLGRNMNFWINYNLLNITEPGEEDIVLLYQGGQKWQEFPRDTLKK